MSESILTLLGLCCTLEFMDGPLPRLKKEVNFIIDLSTPRNQKRTIILY